MNDKQLSEIEARLKNYPEGEMTFDAWFLEDNQWQQYLDLKGLKEHMEQLEGISIGKRRVIHYWAEYADSSGFEIDFNVAALLYHAPTDIAALLNKVRQYEKALEALGYGMWDDGNLYNRYKLEGK